jgi:hypothetical protein
MKICVEHDMSHIFLQSLKTISALINILRRVSIAQLVQKRATDWTAWVRFPAMQKCSLLHVVQTASGAHPVSHPMGKGPLSMG